jgi:hypothetical protein
MQKPGSWVALLTATFLSVTGGASVVEAQHPSLALPPSGTNLYGTDGTETSATLLSFTCAYDWDGFQVNHRKVSCRFATTVIARPGPARVQERLHELDAPEKQQELAAGFAELCQARLTAPTPESSPPARDAKPQQTYDEKLGKACAAGDAAAGKAAARYELEQIWANTCEAFNYGTRQFDFELVDDSTWRSMEGAAVGSAASIRTIWRKKGSHEFAPWNFKQVISGDPTCAPAPFRECAEDTTREWTRDAPMTLTGCQFFK